MEKLNFQLRRILTRKISDEVDKPFSQESDHQSMKLAESSFEEENSNKTVFSFAQTKPEAKINIMI